MNSTIGMDENKNVEVVLPMNSTIGMDENKNVEVVLPMNSTIGMDDKRTREKSRVLYFFLFNCFW